ncbi:hypothetical protein MKL26_02250 [Streptococcus suis]|nr:hypothetical protein [Streptococcus suis]
MEHYSKEVIDAKLEKQKEENESHYQLLEERFNLLDKKIDEVVDYALTKTQNMLLEERIREKIEREAEQKITNRWVIGLAVTIAIFVLKEFLIK